VRLYEGVGRSHNDIEEVAACPRAAQEAKAQAASLGSLPRRGRPH